MVEGSDRARDAIEFLFMVTVGAGLAGFFWNLGKMLALNFFMKIEHHMKHEHEHSQEQ